MGNSEYLSRRTAPLLQEFNAPDSRLLVGTDHTPGSGADARAEGIEYADRDAVLSDRDVETVYVSSATGRHFDDCRRALAAGKHVLVEKPVCLTAEEAGELDGMARACGRTIFECLSYPYHPAWADFSARVRRQRWTGPVSVSAVFRIPGRVPTDFRLHPRHGGAAADLGTYCVDALLRLGAVAEDLGIGTVMFGGAETDGGTALTSRLVDGRLSTYTGSWAIGDSYANSVVVADSRRRLELLRAFSPPVDSPVRVVERRPGAPGSAVVATSAPANATRACLSAGARHVRDTGTAGLVDHRGILRRIAVLEKATAPLPA
ncbi:Gfo/Idh/MocA family protein [Streptomyces sedi]|nr:Gfo/Idh/MocA family oxidoreductase [Streptomyces sedi]